MGQPGRDERLSDSDILREMSLSPDPFVTAPELADRCDYTRQGIRNRLEDLIDEGYVNRREVGSRAVVYWLTDDGKKKAAES